MNSYKTESVPESDIFEQIMEMKRDYIVQGRNLDYVYLGNKEMMVLKNHLDFHRYISTSFNENIVTFYIGKTKIVEVMCLSFLKGGN